MEWLGRWRIQLCVGRNFRRRDRSRDRRLGAQSFMLLLAGLVAATCALAATYLYDTNGRLSVVTNDSGESARYIYDALGNVSAVERFGAGDLAIFAFSPAHGIAGDSVKIQGHGFSQNPAQNTVKFNGTPAVVAGASFHEVITSVPAGATTGPITITVAENTASSSTDFIVDENSAPPIITSVTPLIAAARTLVTVKGKSLNPVSGQTAVALSGNAAVPTAVTHSQIEFRVPDGTGTGKVRVTTPLGVADSAQEIIVVPPGFPSNIEQIKQMVVDSAPEPFSLDAQGQYAAAVFSGMAGDYLSAQFTDFQPPFEVNVRYWLYGMNNQLIATGDTIYLRPTVHLPKLTQSGRYLLLMRAEWGAANWHLKLEKDKQVDVDGSTVALVIAGKYEQRRLIFSPATGVNLGLGISSLVIPGTAAPMIIEVLKPNGFTWGSTYVDAAKGGGQLNLPNMESGDYQLFVKPGNATVANRSLNVTLSSDLLQSITLGATQPIVINRPGQNARLVIDGVIGQEIALLSASQLTAPANRIVYYQVKKPDESFFMSKGIALSNATFNLPNLPVSGFYNVLIDPQNGETLTVNMTLTSRVTQAIAADAVTRSHSTQAQGSTAYLAFDANAGDNLQLIVSDIVLSGGGSTYVNIYGANHQRIGGSLCNPPGPCGYSLTGLAAGRHTLSIMPDGGNGTQTMTFKTKLSPVLP